MNVHGLGYRIRRGAHGVRVCLGIVVTVNTAACAPSPDPQSADPATATVEYYRAHREARDAMLAACANDPGRLAATAECVNAKAAASIEGQGSSRDLPPLDLPGPVVADGAGQDERAGGEDRAGDARAADETGGGGQGGVEDRR